MNPADDLGGTLLDQLASIPERLKASASRIADLTVELNNERRRRNSLIVAGVDQARLSQSDVARAAGVSQPHVVRVLSNAGDDE